MSSATDKRQDFSWLGFAAGALVLVFLFFRPQLERYYTGSYAINYHHDERYTDSACLKSFAKHNSANATAIVGPIACERTKTISDGPDRNLTLNGSYLLEAECRKALAETAQRVATAPNEHFGRWNCVERHRFTWGSNGDDAPTWALGIAVVTLLAVGRQIRIANKQLTKADEQLAFAKDELEAVKEDLALNREAMRRPKMLVKLTVTHDGGYKNCEIVVENVGFRGTDKYRVRVYFPWAADVAGLNGAPENPRPIIAKEHYWLQEFGPIGAYLPGNRNSRSLGSVRIHVPPEGLTILWDIDDEEHHYPTRRFGAIEIVASNDSACPVNLPASVVAWIVQEEAQSKQWEAEADSADGVTKES